jgi:membrane associated rhomboid family serine protease
MEFKQNYTNPTGLTRQTIARNPVFILLSVNVVIFICLQLSDLLLPNDISSVLMNNLMMPLNPAEFIFKPWTLFTYMFLHEGFFHLFFNMIGLLIFGNLFSYFLGDNRIIPVYLTGGILGGLLTLLAGLLPLTSPHISNGVLLGASAAVMAIVIASAFIYPNQVVKLYFLFDVKIKYLGMFMIAMDILSIFLTSNIGGHISHLGGALFGFFYVQQLKNGSDIFGNIIDRINRKRQERARMNMKVHYNKPLTDDEYNEMKMSNRERMDVLLEKIHKNGIGSLSKKEKEFLDKYSQEL